MIRWIQLLIPNILGVTWKQIYSLDVIRALSPYGCYRAQQTDIYRGPTYLLTLFIYLFRVKVELSHMHEEWLMKMFRQIKSRTFE